MGKKGTLFVWVDFKWEPFPKKGKTGTTPCNLGFTQAFGGRFYSETSSGNGALFWALDFTRKPTKGTREEEKPTGGLGNLAGLPAGILNTAMF